jgi:hypothetical protein
MGKKCIPGVFCIENMTLFVLFVIAILLWYIFYTQIQKNNANNVNNNKTPNIIVVTQPTNPASISPLATISARNDPFNDPYSPPMKTDGIYFPRDSGDVRGIPVNVQTRGTNMSYQQVGILTRPNHNHNGQDMILPLMGRRLMTGRDKWQYYTISNTGNMNTKLPVSLNGKSCTGEYGCDDINNGDNVYVEGYNDTFRVTMYENSLFNYIPYL